MAKKTKNGKKGSDDGVGGKGSDEKEKISEVEKEWFQIQLKALEEKLQKKTEKMKAWEALSNEYKEKWDIVIFTLCFLAKRAKCSW